MGDLSKYSDEDLINILSSDTENELKQRGYKHGWYKETDVSSAQGGRYFKYNGEILTDIRRKLGV